MKTFTVKINSIKHITHDVLQIVTKKPQDYNFTPGQATEVSINKSAWKDEKRPFTFTSLPDSNFLEFTLAYADLISGRVVPTEIAKSDIHYNSN